MDNSKERLFVGKIIVTSVNLKAGATIFSDTIPLYPGILKDDLVDVLKIVASDLQEPWCYIRTQQGVCGYIQLAKVVHANV